jgi:hypothetical protein
MEYLLNLYVLKYLLRVYRVLIAQHREQPIGTNVHWESGALTPRDDDPNLVEAYALFFEAYGYTIQPAADGVDALAAYCVSH